jgi:N-acetylglucosaminyldiphosphoundecaprenol N-acetyl-beta-D-mannosaminyltransferase
MYQRIDICTTDGMPLVWFARWKTGTKIERVYGPDLMKTVLQKTQGKKYQHVFFGTTKKTLTQLTKNIQLFAPQLNTVSNIAPPFRKLTDTEIRQYARAIRPGKKSILWIGMSSPKQVVAALQWKQQLPNAAIFCVGAAFDFLAGQTAQAPRWVQQLGLEWLFRLLIEPRRLWHRYGVAIPSYLVRTALRSVFGN